MKRTTIALIALLFSTVFIACGKDSSSPSPATASVDGLFTGKYGFGDETPDKNYSLNFKSTGTIEEIGQSSGNPTGQGTWKLNGTKLSASYKMLFSPYNDYFITAVFDSPSKTISGTWGYETGATDGGKFSLQKH